MRSEDEIRGHPVVTALATLLAPGQECYLVGGAIRDELLGRPVSDFDFATPFDPTDMARTFAGMCGGTWFFLDEERRQSRVVIRREGEEVTCDFAPFRAANLAGDLRLRDFTVNALACRLSPGAERELVDPIGGRSDLAERRLRCCSARSFVDDPLRILKGVRHCAELGLSVERETLERMRLAVGRLEDTAPERICAETAAIFSVPSTVPSLELLDSIGAWPVLLGESAVDARSGASLVAQVEGALKRIDRHNDLRFLQTALAEEVEQGLARRSLVKLSAFVRGCGIVDLPELCRKRLRLGRRAGAVVRSLAGLHRQRAVELTGLSCGPRGRALWCARLGSGRLEALVLLAALEPTLLREDRDAFLETAAALLEHPEGERIPDLISGDWLIRTLGVPPGPQHGKLLDQVRSEEIAGRIRTPQQAGKYLISLKEKGIDKE